MRRSESTDWADHLGHRLTADPAATGGVAGVCLVCTQCGITLAFRPDPEPDRADESPVPVGPVVDGILDFAAALRSMLLDAGRPDPPLEPIRLANGSVVHLPPLDADPYWRGYRDASRSGQQALLSGIFQRLEDLATEFVPAPSRGEAGRFVRASVLDRLRLIRARQDAPRVPKPSGDTSGPPFFAKSGG